MIKNGRILKFVCLFFSWSVLTPVKFERIKFSTNDTFGTNINFSDLIWLMHGHVSEIGLFLWQMVKLVILLNIWSKYSVFTPSVGVGSRDPVGPWLVSSLTVSKPILTLFLLLNLRSRLVANHTESSTSCGFRGKI